MVVGGTKQIFIYHLFWIWEEREKKNIRIISFEKKNMRPNKWKWIANDRPSSVKICEKILWVVSCAEVRVNIGNNSTKNFPINLILRYARSVWMVWFICICYRKFQIKQIGRTSILGWLSVFYGRHFNSRQLLCRPSPQKTKIVLLTSNKVCQ